MTIEQAALQFVRWALTEGSWAGCDIDGGIAQDKAEQLGLIIQSRYDPTKHGDAPDGIEDGDYWFEFSPEFKAAARIIEASP